MLCYLCTQSFTNYITIQQLNAMCYPVLSSMARDYLPIQGSSVPCERVFSDAGLTDTKHRARILPENFGDIQIVKNKFKKERRQHEAEIVASVAERRRLLLDDAVDEVQILQK
jgi:hypothetical protein